MLPRRSDSGFAMRPIIAGKGAAHNAGLRNRRVENLCRTMSTDVGTIRPEVTSPPGPAARHALEIYGAALQAVSADRLVRRALRLTDGVLEVGKHRLELERFRRVYVVGAGKAATPMAQAVEEQLGERIDAGVVVTKYGHSGPTSIAEVKEAGHPVPDAGSVAGGEAVARLAAEAGADDLVIVLISGGASALMELPRPGIALEDIRATTDLLLRSGATITEVNAVRARLSELKHGGLARLIAPAQALCLVLSDVLGSPLESIGSGPCWIGQTTSADASAVLEKYGLSESVPPSAAAAMRDTHERSNGGMGFPPGGQSNRAGPEPIHVLVGDVWTALDAAACKAREMGHRPIIVTGMMQGEAREVALTLAGAARDRPRLKDTDGFDCLLFGGETTVTVRGSGIGGRCQEMACAAIPILAGCGSVCLLAAGTDGTDGPTDAAGAVVDGSSARRADDMGLRPADALARNDTYALLDRIGCLIRTGPTGSNVGDIAVALAT